MYFRNEYDFLSNFYKVDIVIEYGGVHYLMPTSENAFQAMKVYASKATPEEKAEWLKAVEKATPQEAKELGRKLPINLKDWNDMSEEIMYEIIYDKFSYGSTLAQRLIDLGDIEIVEDNNHGDKLWGKYAGEGENKLGKILKKVQLDLIGD